MNIFENLENLNVSEECFNDIMGIVEEILNEDRLVDDNGKKTDAYYALKDKMIDKLQDKKATASSIRKHHEKQAVASKKEEKRIAKQELPKAEYNKQIAWGNRANAHANYDYYKNKEGKSSGDERAEQNWKSWVDKTDKDDEEAYNKLQDVRSKIANASLKSYDSKKKAGEEKIKARDLSDKLSQLKR